MGLARLPQNKVSTVATAQTWWMVSVYLYANI